jgi:hypothetical protein
MRRARLQVVPLADVKRIGLWPLGRSPMIFSCKFDLLARSPGAGKCLAGVSHVGTGPFKVAEYLCYTFLN